MASNSKSCSDVAGDSSSVQPLAQSAGCSYDGNENTTQSGFQTATVISVGGQIQSNATQQQQQK